MKPSARVGVLWPGWVRRAGMSRTFEQKMAADALRKVKTLIDKNYADKYASYAAGLPAAIIANGLGQAAATLLAAAKGDKNDPHMILFEHLEHWLCREDKQAPYFTPAGQPKELMNKIVNNDRDTYMRAQAEALAWLQWLKKFAEAYLK